MKDPWQGFRLVPDDVLFFRDSKPSTRGADHYLGSIFPPHPSTLYGALRTRRLVDERVSLPGLDRSTWENLTESLRDELGEWGGFGTLEIRGPWLLREVRGKSQVLIPAPADLAVALAKRDSDQQRESTRAGRSREARPPRIRRAGRYRLSETADAGPGGHSHGCALLHPWIREGERWQPWPATEDDPRPAAGWLLTPGGLEAWRAGLVPDTEDFVHRTELWIDEGRTGLGLEAGTRRSQDHMLYTFGFLRLRRHVAIGFEARGTKLAGGRRVRLGGEGRTCVLREGPAFPKLSSKVPIGAGERLCLSLATPALSASGGYPPGFSAGGGESTLGGCGVRLLGGVVTGSTLVGGWDLANERAKPLRRALPAGSVLLVEVTGGRGADLDGSCVSDFEQDERLAAQGFGLVVAGRNSQEV